MSSSKYIFTLDLRSVQAQISLPVTQGDTNRTLIISFTDGAKPYVLGEKATAMLSIVRPTGTPVQEYCKVDEGGACAIYEFSEYTVAVAGLHKCQLVLYNAEGKQIASPKFSIDAAPKLVAGDDVVIPDDEVVALDAIYAAEAQRNAAEGARVDAEALRFKAELARKEASKDAIDALNAVKETVEQKLANGDFEGEAGKTPYIQDGYWYIGGENTGVRAEGKNADVTEVPVKSVNGQIGEVKLNASDVNADEGGTAQSLVSGHNTNTDAHNDIRLELQRLAGIIADVLDSDDITLDEMHEIVAVINSNKTLIEAITVNKLNVADIINNLTTNVSNKPLSAAQGVALKALIDALGNNKLDASALTSAINTALAQAKASGAFDGKKGDPGYSPVKGTDFWTDADKEEITAEANALIAAELAKKAQIKPEIAQTKEELEANGDKTKFYALPDNKIYAWMYTEKVVGGSTNRANKSTELDEDGDGVADWQVGYTTSSSGAAPSTEGRDVTNYIGDGLPLKGRTVYFKDVCPQNQRILLYDQNKAFLSGKALYPKDTGATYTGFNGVLTEGYIDFSSMSSTIETAYYMRIAVATGATNPIITVGEPISEGTIENVYAWTDTGHKLTNPADYEDDIIKVTKTANKNAVDIVELKEANEDFDKRLTSLEEVEDTEVDDEIPEYWQTHLAEKIAEIKALQDAGGHDCFSFVVITDIHYESNLGKLSPTLAQRIMDECGIKYCLCLGDTQTRHGAKYDEAYIANEWVGIEKMLSPIRDRLLITQGNHDGSYGWFDLNGDGSINDDINGDRVADTYDKDVYNYTPQKLYERIFRKVSTIDSVIFSTNGRGYYVDDKASRVRYIILNTHVNKWETNADGSIKYNNMYNFRYGQAQFDMVEEALNSVPSNDWSVICASHVPLDRSGEFKAWGSDVEVIDGDNYRVKDEVDDSVLMAGVLNAYTNHDNSDKSKAKYANTSVGTQVVPQEDNFDKVVVDVDFSTAKGTLIGYFGGHNHIDHLLPKNYSWANSAISNCLTITTRCDGAEGRSGDTRTAGTTTEQSFDVFTVNKATRRIYATKIGAGSDRGKTDEDKIIY